MPKTRVQKSAEVKELTEALQGAKGVVFANFAGLKVKDVTELRRRCRAAGVGYFVAKKTLLKVAMEQANASAVNPREIEGGIAMVFGREDELAAAKAVKDFAADHPALKFVGGLMPEASGWRFLNTTEIIALSKLSGRQELLGSLVGTIANPLRGMVGVLAGNLRGLVQVLNAISAKEKPAA